jgi:NADH-quinone oxidoreductase subunit H
MVLFFRVQLSGMSWVVEVIVNIGNIIGFAALFVKLCGFIFLHVKMDYSKILDTIN